MQAENNGLFLGKKIRDLREYLRLSKGEFGNRIHYSNSHIGRIEKGTSQATEQIINDICHAFHVDPDYFAFQSNMSVQDALSRTNYDGLDVAQRLKKEREKGKVESPMRILDELRAYNGRLTYLGFVELLAKINDRENSKVHPGTGKVPLMYLKKERDSLGPLPPGTIRNPYQLVDHKVRVDESSLFRYQGKQYSVPPEYIGKTVTLQIYDDYIHDTKESDEFQDRYQKTFFIFDAVCAGRIL